MKENFTFQQKTKLLTKLFDAGCNNRKEIAAARHGEHFENSGYHYSGYESDYRVSEADQSQ